MITQRVQWWTVIKPVTVRLPHRRGGGPSSRRRELEQLKVAPQAWGWTGMISQQVWGWTVRNYNNAARQYGFPTHVGVDRTIRRGDNFNWDCPIYVRGDRGRLFRETSGRRGEPMNCSHDRIAFKQSGLPLHVFAGAECLDCGRTWSSEDVKAALRFDSSEHDYPTLHNEPKVNEKKDPGNTWSG